MKVFLSLFTFGVAFLFSCTPSKPAHLTVAAASDLNYALDSVITAFKAENPGITIDAIYGSSGKLYEQIVNEAPFDIFFSADIEYANRLQEKGLTLAEPVIYGIGRIVLWSKKTDPDLKQMNTLLDEGMKKIAIANPGHAPYGRRAEESLKHYKLYEQVKDKLVFGENISQTAQFVTTGAADIGIIALSLALSPQMKDGKYYIIPELSHQPLEQGFVKLKHGKDNKNAQSFSDYISSKAGKNILEHFGFETTK